MATQPNIIIPDAPEQPAVRDVEQKNWDALVVGAGPAGCLAAHALAIRNRRVLIVDRGRFPREKICGDGLIADSLAIIDSLGLRDAVITAGREVAGTRLFSPSRYMVELPGPFITCERRILDTLLAAAAAKSGATFAKGEVVAVAAEPNGHAAATFADGSRRAARAIIIATGASNTLPKALGALDDTRPTALALRGYLHATAGLDRLIVSWDRAVTPGYAWIFPMKDDLFNVGIGVFHSPNGGKPPNIRALFDNFCREFPPMAELMARAEFAGPLKGWMLRCGLQGANPLPGGPILLCGEAIGTTYHFTGEGIGSAMSCGRIAGEALADALDMSDKSGLPIDAARLAGYAQRIDTELRPLYGGFARAQRWLSHPSVVDFMVTRSARSKSMRKIAAGILNVSTDPKQLFSLRSILKSYFS